MANSEIAGLTEDTTPDATDNVYAQDAAGAVDKRVPFSALPVSTLAAAAIAAAQAAAAADATAKVAAEATLARNGDNITSGTVADARIASTIARDSEVAAAYQPLDADLTDLAGIADAQGDIIIRGAAGWERLAKSGTATDVLTAGASQPAWAAATGGGGGDDVFIEDPNDPGTYVVGPLYIGETDPAIGGDDIYAWLDPADLGGGGGGSSDPLAADLVISGRIFSR